MTPEREQLVRDTFMELERHAEAAAVIFYDRLFALDPSAQAMFAHVDMAQQGRKFMAMLGSVVQVLDRAPRLVSDVAALGRRHAHLHTTAGHFESAGVALLYAIERTLGDACTAEVRAAWAEAYALIAAVMQRAQARYEHENGHDGRRPAAAG